MIWEFLQSNNQRINLDISLEDLSVRIARGAALALELLN